MDFRAKFIELLTTDTEDNCAIFWEDGMPHWGEVRLDMIMDKFDKLGIM